MNSDKRFRIIPLHEHSEKMMHDKEWSLNQDIEYLDHGVIHEGKEYSITRDIELDIIQHKNMYNLKQSTINNSGFINFGTIDYNTAPNQFIINNASIHVLNNVISIPKLEINLSPNDFSNLNGDNYFFSYVYLTLVPHIREIMDDYKVTQEFDYIEFRVDTYNSPKKEIDYYFLEDLNTLDEDFIHIGKFTLDNKDKGIYRNITVVEDKNILKDVYALPLFIVKRRNTKKFSVSNWNGSIDRPDNKYNLDADTIYDFDIIDVRHKLTLHNSNWSDILRDNLDKLFRGKLRTTEQLQLFGNYFGSRTRNTGDGSSYAFYQKFKSLNPDIANSTTTKSTNGTLISNTPTSYGVKLANCTTNTRCQMRGSLDSKIIDIEFYMRFKFSNENMGILELSSGTTEKKQIFGGIVYDKDDSRLEFFVYENTSINKYFTTLAMTESLKEDEMYHLIRLSIERPVAGNQNNGKVIFYVDGKENSISYHSFHVGQELTNVNMISIGKVLYNESEEDKPEVDTDDWTYIYGDGLEITDLAIINNNTSSNSNLLSDKMELGNGYIMEKLLVLNNKPTKYNFSTTPMEIIALQYDSTSSGDSILEPNIIPLNYNGMSNTISKTDPIFVLLPSEIINAKLQIWSNVGYSIIVAVNNKSSEIIVIANRNQLSITALFHYVPYQGVGNVLPFNKDIILTELKGVAGIPDQLTNTTQFSDYAHMLDMLPVGRKVTKSKIEKEKVSAIVTNIATPFVITPINLSKPLNEYNIGTDYIDITSISELTPTARGYESFGLIKKTFTNDFLFNLDNSKNTFQFNNTNVFSTFTALVYCSYYEEVVLLVNTVFNDNNPRITHAPDYTPTSANYGSADIFFLEDRPLVKNVNLDNYYNSYYQKNGNPDIISRNYIKVWQLTDWLNPMKEWYPSDLNFPSDNRYPMMAYDDRIKYIELCRNGSPFYRKFRIEQIDAPTNIVNTTFSISSDDVMGVFDEIRIYGGDIATQSLQSGALLDTIKLDLDITDNVILYITRKDIKGW